MIKKRLAAVGVLLAAAVLVTVPASAASILAGDNFGKNSESEWETDRYEPEEWDTSENELYIAIGKSGYRGSRPESKKDKTYAYQGRKMAVERASSNTWTATIKLNVTGDWFTSSSNRRRAEFRLDLVDASGAPIAHSPAIALVNGGGETSMLKFYNPKAVGSWGAATSFVNGDKEREDLMVSEGWHTLYIKSVNGVITYYLDSMKLGNCTLPDKEVYPSYVGLNAYNYEAPYAVIFDSFYLYDGAYSPPALLSEEKQEEKEDKKASAYEKKRSAWVSRYTKSGVLTKDIPDSYWDY